MPLITTYFRAKVDGQTIDDDIVLGLHVKPNGISIAHLNPNVVDNQTIEKDLASGLRVKAKGIKLDHLNDEVLVLLLSLL